MPHPSFKGQRKGQLHPFDTFFKHTAVSFFWNEYAKRCAMKLDTERYEAGRILFNELIASFSDSACHSSPYSNCYNKSVCEQHLYEAFLNGDFENGEILCASGERTCSYNPNDIDNECLRCFLKITKSLQEKYPCYSYEFYSEYDPYYLLQSYISLEEDKSKVSDGAKTKHSPLIDITGVDGFYSDDDISDFSSSQSVIALNDFLPDLRVPFFGEIVFENDLNIELTIAKRDYLYSQASDDELLELYSGKNILPRSFQEGKGVEEILNLSTSIFVVRALKKHINEIMSNSLIGRGVSSSVFWRLAGLAVWDFVMQEQNNGETKRSNENLGNDFDEKIQDLMHEFSLQGFCSPKFKKIEKSNSKGFSYRYFRKTKLAITDWEKKFCGKSFSEF